MSVYLPVCIVHVCVEQKQKEEAQQVDSPKSQSASHSQSQQYKRTTF